MWYLAELAQNEEFEHFPIEYGKDSVTLVEPNRKERCCSISPLKIQDTESMYVLLAVLITYPSFFFRNAGYYLNASAWDYDMIYGCYCDNSNDEQVIPFLLLPMPICIGNGCHLILHERDYNYD